MGDHIYLKVPKNIRSKSWRTKCYICFKNLTDDCVNIYWIDYNSKAQLMTTLKPMNRCDPGAGFSTYVTHPWVAVGAIKKQLLLNGKRYLFPPKSSSENDSLINRIYKKWILSEIGELEKKYPLPKGFEVVIENPGVEKLRTLALIYACELYPCDSDAALDNIPKVLKEEIRYTKTKYFL